MTTQIFIALVFAMVLSVYVAIATRTWVRVRGRRVVVCPETQRPVTVTLDVGHALATAVWEKADLTLTSCTRWPERKDCDQACVRQIEIAPFDTMPKELARRYFMEQHCSICQRPIEPPGSVTLQPGFMHPVTHKVNSWDEIAPEQLPEAIATSHPLCSNCTLAEAFRQRFPDREVDRLRH